MDFRRLVDNKAGTSMSRHFVAASVAAMLMNTAFAIDEGQDPCADDTHADPTVVAITCGQTSEYEAFTGTGVSEQNDLSSFSYVWLPTCPDSLPDGNNSGAALDCRGAHVCNDPALMSTSLWAMQTRNSRGLPVKGGWTYLGSECRDPATQGPTQQRRALTWQDVLSAVRRVGPPPGSVKAPRYTLVNLETTFYTKPQTVNRSLTIISYNVDVHIEPASYTWHWGDGDSDTTRTPGQPYPSTQVTHTYSRATHDDNLSLSVDVTYTARYRVAGGPWQQIPTQLTINGAATALPVKEASAVLVAND